MTYDEMIEIIQAAKNGEAIEYLGAGNRWIELPIKPSFDSPMKAYRVKEPQTYHKYVNVYRSNLLSDSSDYIIKFDTKEQADDHAEDHNHKRISGFWIGYTEGWIDD